MIRSPKANDKATVVLASPAFLLFNTAIDTTWRVCVPPLLGTIVGIFLDNLLKTKPIMTMIFILSGIIVSSLLLAMQIRRVRKNDNK